MQLNREEYQRIFKKYLEGNANPEEVDFIEAYYEAFGPEENYTETLGTEERSRLEASLKEKIERNINKEKPDKNSNKLNYWLKYSAAAVILLVASVSFFYSRSKISNTGRQKERTILVSRKEQVKESGEQPILKLANGKVISLEGNNIEQAIHEEGGVTIERNGKQELVYKSEPAENTLAAAENLFNEILIPRGKQMKVVLPDGSRVWINAGSTLKYPIAFSRTERRVKLSGEAYFEVEKDKNRPFKVITRGNEVRVTGTHFNVSAYEDDNVVKTTLLEGSVGVYFNKQSVQLIPGEQAVSNMVRLEIKKLRVEAESEVAWKSGYFVFDEPMSEVMKIMARWYDLDFKIAADVPERNVAGRFSRSRDYRQILSYLGNLGDFGYSVNGKTVLLKKKY